MTWGCSRLGLTRVGVSASKFSPLEDNQSLNCSSHGVLSAHNMATGRKIREREGAKQKTQNLIT